MQRWQDIAVLVTAALVGSAAASASHRYAAAGRTTDGGACIRSCMRARALKSITLNTQAYTVDPGRIDRRTIKLVAPEDMHIVALEHFVGVGRGSWSDNGHLLSTRPENPWVRWQEAGTGMEPTGVAGYFGYCGRDYYSEAAGVQDIMLYESFPAGTYFLVLKGQTLYLHTYAHNFSRERTAVFHHVVRLLYW